MSEPERPPDMSQKWISLEDLLKKPPESWAAEEQAYRRGFYQGVYAAWDAIERGATDEQMRTWLYTKLHEWRYDSPLDDFVEPPIAPPWVP